MKNIKLIVALILVLLVRCDAAIPTPPSPRQHCLLAHAHMVQFVAYFIAALVCGGIVFQGCY